MLAISLQSGSNGNSIYVEAGGKRLLFDAGISGKQAELRLAAHGRRIRDVDALLISHDHADHVSCAGIYQRKFGIPIHATARTFAAANRYALGRTTDVRHFAAGETLRLDGLTIETVRTPHDGADGVGFVIDDGKSRLGVLTDLGHVFSELSSVLESLDAVILESNYDVDMLEGGPYPAFLKARIAGPGGHISNIEAAELLRAHAGPRLKWACLAHLSGDNNTPELAMETHRRVLRGKLPIRLATRYGAGEVMAV